MKLTRVVKGDDAELYGFNDNGVVNVNIQKLWEDFPDEDKFIKEFSNTYTHELMHTIVDAIVYEIVDYYGEYVIRVMLGEPWTEDLKDRLSLHRRNGFQFPHGPVPSVWQYHE